MHATTHHQMRPGQNIRREPGYRALAELEFSKISMIIRQDLLCIPYTKLIMECEA